MSSLFVPIDSSRAYQLPSEMLERAIDTYINTLNNEQREAVIDIAFGPTDTENYSTDTTVAYIVIGPPGTGKTFVICCGAILYLALRNVHRRRRRQVIIATFTHEAANRALEILANSFSADPRIVKRVLPSTIVPRVRRDYLERYREYIISYTNLRSLGWRQRQEYSRARIFITTIDSIDKVNPFIWRPLLIFDEASQISDPLFAKAIYGVVKNGRDLDYVVIVGDPEQLQFVSHQPDLKESVIRYLIERRRIYNVHRLRVQYRMHPKICELINAMRQILGSPDVTGYPLEPDASTNRTLADDYGMPRYLANYILNQIVSPNNVVAFVDTSNVDTRPLESGQWFNPMEARLALAIWKAFSEAYNNRIQNSMILSPYTEHISLIERLATEVNIQVPVITIDRAQGREYDLVVISCVRHNNDGFIGFLQEEEERMYVACSRARRKLVIICHRDTFELSGSRIFRTLFRFIDTNIRGVCNIRLNKANFDSIVREQLGDTLVDYNRDLSL